MKTLLALAFSLTSFTCLVGLPVYNPAQPQLLEEGAYFCCYGGSGWDMEFGYRGDFVINRKMKLNQKNASSSQSTISNYDTRINGTQLTVNYWECLEFYGWAGSSQTNFRTQLSYVPGSLVNLQLSTRDGFGYGGGVRGVLLKHGCTSIGFDAQYSHSKNTLDNLTVNGTPIIDIGIYSDFITLVDPANFHLRYREYQFSIGISHEIDLLSPYLAVKYSLARAKLNGPIMFFNTSGPIFIFNASRAFKSRNHLGLAAGLSLVNHKRMHLTIEGRFFDETAITLSSDIRF